MLTSALLMFSLFSCDKDNLLDPSQIKESTMSAKIDGKDWTHNGAGGGLNSEDIRVSYFSDGTLHLLGNQSDGGNNQNVSLGLVGVTHTGDYSIGVIPTGYITINSGNYGAVNYFQGFRNTHSYSTPITNSGKVTITKLDTQNKTISGTFSFRATLAGSTTKYVDVTEGRFEVKYQ